MPRTITAAVLCALGLCMSVRAWADDAVSILGLYGNTAAGPDVQTDGGFACLITGTEKTILFDTGKDGSILLHNLERLGVDCDRIDIVVLSHFHQDHLGGLNAFLKRHAKVSIYVPRSFLQRPDYQQAIAGFDSRVIPVTASQPICREVYSTGMMGREGIKMESEMAKPTAERAA